MGPPFFDGGNKIKQIAFIRELIASMGPPFFDGGNAEPADDECRAAVLLQWGRRFLTAETCSILSKTSPKTLLLQWGRRFLTAETQG